MSLLMEALRKAEQVKKRAAGGDHPPEPPDRDEIPGERLPSATPPAVQQGEGAEPGPELGGCEGLEIESREDDGAAEAAVQETGEAPDVWEMAEAGEEITVVEDAPSPDPDEGDTAEQKAAPTPAPEPPVRETAQATAIPASGQAPEPAAALPAAPVIPTTGASVEASKRAARAVFVAKIKHQRLARTRRILLIAGTAGLALLGLAGFLYFSNQGLKSFTTPFATPVSAVKKGAPPPGPMPAPPEAAGPGPGVPAPSPAAGTAETRGAGDAPAPSEQKPSAARTQAAAPPGDSVSPGASVPVRTPETAAPATTASVSASQRGPAPAAASPVQQDFPYASQHEEKPLLPRGPQAYSAPSIQITRHPAPPPGNPLLAAAYAAYQRGDFDQSRREYRQILQADPEHRGALLGLAALALRMKETGPARDLYLRLLERDPSDPLARLGLTATMPAGDPVRLESELKLLLEVHPDLAPLSFALGNLYAAGQRWSEAQQAYFNALQAARKAASPPEAVSPDYPYNLAVSLEHLEQSKLAATYYREALKLAAHQPAGFDTETLRQRLSNLNPTEAR